jgi:5-formyltetrahydrofolate cyclo-ligase
VSQSYPDGVTAEEADALRALAKEELRKRVAAIRRTLSSETRAAHARAMSALLLAEPAFREARVLLAYSALRFEIDAQAVIEAAWAAGKTVALPRIVPETRALDLHVYREGDELCESGFVVKEPLPTASRIAHEEVELVLVPGLAFDVRGQRLGYGQGYYDRLLPQLPRARRIGLAFELSLLVEVPSAAHDVPVDCVITERRVIRAQRDGDPQG